MADLALITGATGVEPLWPEKATIISGLASETVANGQAAYQTSSGTYGLADANGSGKQQFRGIFLQGGGAGQAVSILMRGSVGGYDLTNIAYDGLAYLSDTAGSLAETNGTMTVPVGRVFALSDPAKTKVLFVDVAGLSAWS